MKHVLFFIVFLTVITPFVYARSMQNGSVFSNMNTYIEEINEDLRDQMEIMQEQVKANESDDKIVSKIRITPHIQYTCDKQNGCAILIDHLFDIDATDIIAKRSKKDGSIHIVIESENHPMAITIKITQHGFSYSMTNSEKMTSKQSQSRSSSHSSFSNFSKDINLDLSRVSIVYKQQRGIIKISVAVNDDNDKVAVVVEE